MSVRARWTAGVVFLGLTGLFGAPGTAGAANSGSFVLTATSTGSRYAPTFTGNGLLGVRVPPAGQGYAGGTVPAQSELAGFYAKPSAGKAPERVQQRANIPTWSALSFADGGRAFSPFKVGKTSGWRQSIDLHTGVISTTARWTAPDSHVTDISYQVLTDRGREHVGLVQLVLTPHWSRHRDGDRRDRRHREPRHRAQVAAGAHHRGGQGLEPGRAQPVAERQDARHGDHRGARRSAGSELEHHRAQRRDRPGGQPERGPADHLSGDRRADLHADQVRRRRGLQHRRRSGQRRPTGFRGRRRGRLRRPAGRERRYVGEAVAGPDRRQRQSHRRDRRQRQRVLPVVQHSRRSGLERLPGRPVLQWLRTGTSSGTPRRGCSPRCWPSIRTWPGRWRPTASIGCPRPSSTPPLPDCGGPASRGRARSTGPSRSRRRCRSTARACTSSTSRPTSRSPSGSTSWPPATGNG